jgi:phytoene dehydrogenase-like protein
LAEGNTVFLSLSPDWDGERAPAGQRALTLSTHTRLEPWWDLYECDRFAYEARKDAYKDRLLSAAEVAFPHLRDAATLILPGTPVTFQRFTHRAWGWVGGFPQTSLFRAWGPRLAPGLWMVGDSIFPGQSTAAVALGGLRVAGALLSEVGLPGRRTTRLDERMFRSKEIELSKTSVEKA